MISRSKINAYWSEGIFAPELSWVDVVAMYVTNALYCVFLFLIGCYVALWRLGAVLKNFQLKLVSGLVSRCKCTLNRAEEKDEINDCNAALVAAMRSCLTQAPDPFTLDPLEWKVGFRLLPLPYRVVSKIIATVGISVLFKQPWLGYMAARTKVIDDLMKRLVVEKNVKQIIILGAGYDTRPYRLSKILLHGDGSTKNWERARVIEIDQAPVQKRKMELLKKAMTKEEHDEISSYVTFVDCNFESNNDLHAAFARACVDTERRTLIIWEGVVWYLTASAVENTLSVLSSTFDEQVLMIECPTSSAVEGRFSTSKDRLLAAWMKANNREIKFGVNDDLIIFTKYGYAIKERLSLREMYYQTLQMCNVHLMLPPDSVMGMSTILLEKTKEEWSPTNHPQS